MYVALGRLDSDRIGVGEVDFKQNGVAEVRLDSLALNDVDEHELGSPTELDHHVGGRPEGYFERVVKEVFRGLDL